MSCHGWVVFCYLCNSDFCIIWVIAKAASFYFLGFIAAVPNATTGQKSNQSWSSAMSNLCGATTYHKIQSIVKNDGNVSKKQINSVSFDLDKLERPPPLQFFHSAHLCHIAFVCVCVWPVSPCFGCLPPPPNKHGVITTEDEQYLIEPLKNISAPASGERDLEEEAQQHVIYKMSAMASPQEHSQELSCGLSGWWTSIWATDSVWVELT